jgi:hypothetical protein
MTNFVSTLCLVLLCSAIFLGSSTLAAAQKSGLDGTYILDQVDEIAEQLPTTRESSKSSRSNEKMRKLL